MLRAAVIAAGVAVVCGPAEAVEKPKWSQGGWSRATEAEREIMARCFVERSRQAETARLPLDRIVSHLERVCAPEISAFKAAATRYGETLEPGMPPQIWGSVSVGEMLMKAQEIYAGRVGESTDEHGLVCLEDCPE